MGENTYDILSSWERRELQRRNRIQEQTQKLLGIIYDTEKKLDEASEEERAILQVGLKAQQDELLRLNRESRRTSVIQ